MDKFKKTVDDVYFNYDDYFGKKILSCYGSNFEVMVSEIDRLISESDEDFIIKIRVSNVPNKYELDYSCFEKYGTRVTIHYGKEVDYDSDYDTFIKYQKEVRKIKDKISDDLSPLEKLTIVYDAIKSKPYKKSDDLSEQGCPHLALTGDHIVCRGYSSIMDEILSNEECIKTSVINYDSFYDGTEGLGHARVMVLINDVKYGVNGLYILDPTFDSYKKEYENDLGPDYNQYDLYGFYMIPFNDEELYKLSNNGKLRISFLSKNLYLGDKNHLCYDCSDSINYDQMELLFEILEKCSDSDLNIINDVVFDNMFAGMSREETIGLIKKSNEKLSIENLEKLVFRVRIAEGFTQEEACKASERAIEFRTRVESNSKNK